MTDLLSDYTVPCRCGHDEASHRHLDECREDGCPCGVFIPKEEDTIHE